MASRMILLGGLAHGLADAASRARSALESGRAYEVFLRFVQAQGGDARFVDGRARLRHASLVREVRSAAAGYVSAIDALHVGLACVQLGAGRRSVGQEIDHAVGVVIAAPVGARVDVGGVLALVHANDETTAVGAEGRVRAAFRLSAEPPCVRRRVIEVLEPGE